MLKQLRNNENGVVFVIVLSIILVMGVLAISILGINITQVITTERAIQDTQAEVLAVGALSYAFANYMSSAPADVGVSISYTENLGTTGFSIIANRIGLGLPGYATSNVIIDVTY